MQLVFIHGSGCTERVWKYQSRHFQGSITASLPGHHEGKLIDSVPALAAWLKHFVDKNKLTNLVLVGHSLGGGVALQYALDYPEDVHALVLVASGGRLRVHPDTIEFMRRSLTRPEAITQMTGGFWQHIEPNFASELAADAMSLGPAVFLNDFLACNQFDVLDRLDDIRVPTLCIVGDQDVMTPVKYTEFLVEKIPDAEMVTIEQGTHFVLAEYPEQVNAAIDRFLNKVV